MNISEKLFERYKIDFSDVKLRAGGYQNFSNLAGGSKILKKKVKDLTGQRFGRLTVIERDMTDTSNRSKWICRCDCGNIKSVYRAQLVTGNTISCGCAKKGTNLKDITGQRFGRLTVLERTEKKLDKSYVYKCKCDCGKICFVSSAYLKSGKTKSCGCYSKEIHKMTFKEAFNTRDKYYTENTDILYLSNLPIQKNNTSGCTGVVWDKSVKLWKASIVFQGKRYYLGSSVKIEKAIELRKKAEKEFYGDFLKWYAEEHPKQWEKMQERKMKPKKNVDKPKSSKEL